MELHINCLQGKCALSNISEVSNNQSIKYSGQGWYTIRINEWISYWAILNLCSGGDKIAKNIVPSNYHFNAPLNIPNFALNFRGEFAFYN